MVTLVDNAIKYTNPVARPALRSEKTAAGRTLPSRTMAPVSPRIPPARVRAVLSGRPRPLSRRRRHRPGARYRPGHCAGARRLDIRRQHARRGHTLRRRASPHCEAERGRQTGQRTRGLGRRRLRRWLCRHRRGFRRRFRRRLRRGFLCRLIRRLFGRFLCPSGLGVGLGVGLGDGVGCSITYGPTWSVPVQSPSCCVRRWKYQEPGSSAGLVVPVEVPSISAISSGRSVSPAVQSIENASASG